MRRASDRARLLYLYVLTIADAEGRWEADAEELADGAWSATHGVCVEDVEAALQELEAMGAILLYEAGGRRCGWITDWYQAQNIGPRYRDGSDLPPPPVEINSWAALDRVRAEYARRMSGGANVSRRAALAWYHQLPGEERRRILQNGSASTAGEMGKITELVVERAQPLPDLNGRSEKEKACELLAPLFGGVPDGAVATVEGALATDEEAKSVIVAAATALRGKYDAGERVHGSWLAREVLDLLDRKRKQRAAGPAKKYPSPKDDSEGI